MLNLNNDNNIMYFKNDDDFAVFCLNPAVKVIAKTDANGNTSYVMSQPEFTKMYQDAVKCGIKFCIQDVNSHVNKDGLLGWHDCTMKIDNVERYYGE